MGVIELTQRETMINQPNPLMTLEGHQLLDHIISSGGVELVIGSDNNDVIVGSKLVLSVVERLGALGTMVITNVAHNCDIPDSVIVNIRHDKSDSDRKLF